MPPCCASWRAARHAGCDDGVAPSGGAPSVPRVRNGIRRDGNLLNLPDTLWNSPFLKATRGESAPRTPIWLMRQAGRYMAHYRKMRSGRGFLELCRDPAAAAEVTCYARDWLDVDAAIIFSDILVLLEALDMQVEFTTGTGPCCPSRCAMRATSTRWATRSRPGRPRLRLRRHPPDRARTAEPHPGHRLLRRAVHARRLRHRGGGSRQFALTRKFIYREPEAWHACAASWSLPPSPT